MLNVIKKSLLIICLCLINLLPSSPIQTESARLQYDPSLLQTGDIILRRGRSIRSHFVLMTDRQSSFSHAGLIQKTGDSLFVIHVLPTETSRKEDTIVQIEPLDIFLSPDRTSLAAVYRLRKDSNQYAPKAIEAALSYVEQQIRFDGDFDLKTSDKLYCTELIWCAYLNAGFDLIDGEFDKLLIPLGKGAYILPSRLTKSRQLQLVCSLNPLTSKK